MTKKIIFSAGGTGGHIFPSIKVMKHFFEKGYNVLIVTDIRGKNFIKDYPEFKSYILTSSTTTKKNFFSKILSLFIIFYSILKSIIILKKEKPDLVFGFGGYVSFPISLASKFFNIPLFIYENNVVLGRANRFLSKFSKKILIAKDVEFNFPKKYKKKSFIVGHILDKKIIEFSESAKSTDKNNFKLLVLGGSQGAEIFGKIIPPTINKIKEQGVEIEIIQQCLPNQKDEIANFYFKNKIKSHLFNFEKNILKLIVKSDLAVTRCGASTTSELIHLSTPFIAIPLPDSIDNHQYLNAKYYENKGCCWILEEKNFNINNFFNFIMKTIKNKNELENIRENMKKDYNKDVYGNVENEIKEFI